MKKIISLFLFGFIILILNVCEVKAEVVPFPKPNVNVSPSFNAVDGNNALKLVESPETQGAILEKIEGGAEYGMSQKGYVPNPLLEGTMAVYSVYQALSALYGDSPDYQAFIAPYKEQDDWIGGKILPVNTILGTFTYGEIRLDAAIDSATGEILAAYLSFQDGFEQTVDNLLSKLNNNFYCPVAPPAECEEYGLTQLAPVPAYSVNLRSDGCWGYVTSIYPTKAQLETSFSEENFVCFLKNKTDSDITRQLVVVIKTDSYYYEKYVNGFTYSFSITDGKYNEKLSEIVQGITYGDSAVRLKLVAQAGGYSFYACDDVLHFLKSEDLCNIYNFPYCSYSMSLNDFVAYYVDNAGEMSVGGVSFTPVQPSSQAFPQPGNVYNPADLQEYNENQREKIEECPVINPESQPYPGSEPAPGVKPEKRTLPQIVPDPATGGITVVPLPTPEPSPSPDGEPVIDPDTGGEVDKGSLSPYMFDLSKKFPFCVPFDLIECIKIMKQKPVAPSFEWTMEIKMIDFKYTFRIDLKSFEPAAKVCRVMFTLLFIVSLIMATRNMIRG